VRGFWRLGFVVVVFAVAVVFAVIFARATFFGLGGILWPVCGEDCDDGKDYDDGEDFAGPRRAQELFLASESARTVCFVRYFFWGG
jgi:hypothetical protein